MTSLPQLRALALSASVLGHSSFVALAYVHSARAPQATPAASDPPIEVSLAELTEPAPPDTPAGAAAPGQVRSASPSAAVARVAPLAPTPQVGVPAAVAPVEPSAPLVAAEHAEPEAPRFVIQAPVIQAPAIQASAVQVNGGPGGNAQAGQVGSHGNSESAPFGEGQVDSPAKLQFGTPPSYTAAAEAAGIEVELPLELVIDATGSVQSARTLQHVGYGLDEAAVAAVRRYRFKPAWRGGKPVAVRMRWLLRFQLR